MGQSKVPSVLFVCLGNICRSPMAEGAFRKAAAEAELECDVDSAGTAAYHVGSAPDRRAITTARSHDVDISGARGRQLEAADFHQFSHIFALDAANLAGVRARAPDNARAEVSLLMDAVPGREGQPVDDPYYGDHTDFETAWSEIDVAVRHIVARLQNEGA